MENFRTVEKAWPVLQDSGATMLYVQFESPYKVHERPHTQGKPEMYCDYYDGVAEYGVYDARGAWESSRPSIINATIGAKLVPIVEVVRNPSHPLFPCMYMRAITKEFAEVILEEYAPDFELFEVKMPNEHGYVFRQKLPTIPTGTRVIHPKEGDVVVDRAIELNPSSMFPVTVIQVHTADSERKESVCTFNELPKLYKGFTTNEFHTMWVGENRR